MPTLNCTSLLETPKALGATKATIQEMNLEEGKMGNQQATLAEIAWLAGFVDGDGYIGLTKNSCHDKKTKRFNTSVTAMLHISNCDEEIILKARDVMRKLGLNPYIRMYKEGKRSRKRDHYRVQVKHMRKMIKLLTPLIPYMTGNKKQRAELVLEFCESRLNQKPVPLPKIDNGGRANSGTCKPFTVRQLEILEECGKLSARGASSTARTAARKKSEIQRIKAIRKVCGFGQPSRAEDTVRLYAKV
jgi:hypothetical protein